MYDSSRQTFTCPNCRKTFPVAQCVLVEEGHTRFWSVRPNATPLGLIPFDDNYSTSGGDAFLLECPDCRGTAPVPPESLQWDSDSQPPSSQDGHSSSQPRQNSPVTTLTEDGGAPIRRLPTVLELTEREPHGHQAGPVLRTILERVYPGRERGDPAPTADCPNWLLDLLDAARLSYANWPRTWTYTRELQGRAAREGWDLYESDKYGTQVQRTDSPDVDEAPDTPLPTDDAAISLARAAGVPCLDDGTFPDDIEIIWE